MTNKNEAKKRRPYRKPQLEQITLRPEEAVLGGCSTDYSSGPYQAVCNYPTVCQLMPS
jgi:hypothetical protein